ncbi:hypothetical protein P691DRAFT_797195 [Macrolepiota fuliginosa MF-IS2]|uniref:RanBD1 domain-containing protein n=1 Tax=Macrolepiota fuliginosa MF-IS2 TaxID=1400762 RepID=A0A9P5XP76_9AGAR|nr:hypothetical protein P691DRAFT_797195 [Macrolepiota fuliginosa MF-IS2]
MFPVSDFNFMVAGIATFAATVGYTYARGKLNNTTAGPPSNTEIGNDVMSAVQEKVEPSQSEILATAGPSSTSLNPPTRRGSLKRKEPHDGFEDEETNLAHIYPRKRCRTPSTDKDKGKKPTREWTPSFSEDVSVEDWIFIHHINSPNAVVNEPPRTPSPGAPTPAAEVSDSPLLTTTSIPPTEEVISEEPTPVLKEMEIQREQTPIATPVEDKAETKSVEATTPEANLARPNPFATLAFAPTSPFPKVSLQKPIGSPFKSRGFADFAGTKSAFGTFTSSQASSSKHDRPIWTVANNSTSDARPESKEEEEEAEHAITQATPTTKPIKDRVTGEENEDVEMELKGVKLFVKRGDGPFAEGIVGHLKLLADRTTLDERLLFRREPLWKVSMNIRISPSVRCSYDSTENILRIVIQEPVAESQMDAEKDEKSPLGIVVYAMKPGRACPKQDFKEFSETLIKNSRLKLSSSA